METGGGGDLLAMGHTLKCFSDGRWECLGLPSPSLCHNVYLCWCHPGLHRQRNGAQALPPCEGAVALALVPVFGEMAAFPVVFH